jgi:tRNA (cmo5U34)-methyltransferase
MSSGTDRLFAGVAGKDNYQPEDFVFDEKVVRVFPDMIRRSVPGYNLIVPNTALLARQYAQDESVLYDLGCSLGAVTIAMQQSVKARDVSIIAVDSSEPMIARMREFLKEQAGEEKPVADSGIPVRTVVADICDIDIHDASVVVLNFTLQFVEPRLRAGLLDRIAAGLRSGGALILSEKIRFDSVSEQDLQTDWYHAFKRAQGYSELEVATKRQALENVMKPDTEATHVKRLAEAGFRESFRWFQCFSFASFVAIK